MRIATWNVERLVHKKQFPEILLACEQAKADILVLTETDEQIHPSFCYCFQTRDLTEIMPGFYRPTERRVSIFTNYKCVKHYSTYDGYTSLCVELETEIGNLCVYGTIIGIEGNRRDSFKADLQRQILDFKCLAVEEKNLCIAGDYNISFSDNYYFTNYGRETLMQSFRENNIRLLTAHTPECIDHIAVSESFVQTADVIVSEWNFDKSLSDHKGIVVDIQTR